MQNFVNTIKEYIIKFYSLKVKSIKDKKEKAKNTNNFMLANKILNYKFSLEKNFINLSVEERYKLNNFIEENINKLSDIELKKYNLEDLKEKINRQKNLTEQTLY